MPVPWNESFSSCGTQLRIRDGGEAFLDVTGSTGLFGPAPEIARTIKCEIRKKTKMVASVGVAPNKFLAKIASDLEKPNGLVVVDPLPIGRLWGVGKVTGGVLDQLGVIRDGASAPFPVEGVLF